MEEAVRRTGLDDFGDIPFAEPLDVYLEALEREARVEGERRARAAEDVVSLLVKRLRLVDDRRKHPQIAAEEVVAPIFIVGLPRTGSTHLHGLLGEVEGIRAPRFWEGTIPSPPPEADTYRTDPRIEQMRAMLEHVPPEMMVRHPIAADRPEQCNMLYDWQFHNQAWLASYDIPTYRNYIFDADYHDAFEAHRRSLQHLQWKVPGQWVLKYPKHLLTLDALFEKYPDARLVWTHRDPAVVVPSAISLTGYMRSTMTPDYDPVRFGREWVTMEELALLRGLAWRDRFPDAEKRVVDVHYHDLMADPVGTIQRIFDHFGMTFPGSGAAAIETYGERNPRTKHGVHRYSAEEFGLSPSRLRERFGPYIERFGVRVEERAG